MEQQQVEGEETFDPSFGMPARWIQSRVRTDAEAAGYVVVGPSTVVATHLLETLKAAAAELLGRQDVQEMLGVPLLGAIPEDTEVIVSTNRGEPLVLKKKLTLAGIAYENAARRVVGKQDFMIDLERPKKSLLQRTKEFFTGAKE